MWGWMQQHRRHRCNFRANTNQSTSECSLKYTHDVNLYCNLYLSPISCSDPRLLLLPFHEKQSFEKQHSTRSLSMQFHCIELFYEFVWCMCLLFAFFHLNCLTLSLSLTFCFLIRCNSICHYELRSHLMHPSKYIEATEKSASIKRRIMVKLKLMRMTT